MYITILNYTTGEITISPVDNKEFNSYIDSSEFISKKFGFKDSEISWMTTEEKPIIHNAELQTDIDY